MFKKHINYEDMKKEKTKENISSGTLQYSCNKKTGCRVESVLTVDERGQILLPKDVRERADIRAGDKLALISWEKDDTVCCFALMKTENLNCMVKDMLSPLINDTGV